MSACWSRWTDLTPVDCLRRLAATRVARLGVVTADGPMVLPVNHAVVDGSVVVRTGLDTTLAAATRDAVVAVEADEIDDVLRTAWSVVVVGHAEHVTDPQEAARLLDRLPDPWPAGLRPVVVRVAPTTISGRRFDRD